MAISDELGLIARPLEVVARDEVVARVSEIVKSNDVSVLVLGLPTRLGGGEGTSAEGARGLGEELAEKTGLRVVYVDEKYTSRLAEEALLGSGMKRRKRREKVDKVAAAIILQSFLDRPAGSGNSDSP